MLTPCWLPFVGYACQGQNQSQGSSSVMFNLIFGIYQLAWLGWPASSGDPPIAVSHNLLSLKWQIQITTQSAFYTYINLSYVI